MTSPTIRDRVAAVLGRDAFGFSTHTGKAWIRLTKSDLAEILDKLDAVQASHARAVEDMGDAVEARQKAEQELCKAKAHYQTLVDHAVRALEDTCRSGAGITKSDPTWVASVVRCIAEERDHFQNRYYGATDEIAELRAEFQKSNHAVKCEFDRSNRLIEAADKDSKRIRSLEDSLSVAEQRIEGLNDTLRDRDEVIAELRQKLDSESLADANTRHTLREKVAEQKAQIDSLREELSKANEQVHELTIANREESRAFATVRDSAVERRLATAEACISLLAQMPAEVSKLARRVAEIEGGASDD